MDEYKWENLSKGERESEIKSSGGEQIGEERETERGIPIWGSERDWIGPSKLTFTK